ncbi:MAG: response receiver sensor phosphatase, partial [uncultured bacterium]
KVQDGDLLLLFTDGITEAESPEGEFFGMDRLRQVVAREHSKPAAGVIAAVMESVRAFTGCDTFNDDISMLLLKFGTVTPHS